MDFLKKYGELIKKLYQISNPIIKYRIDKDLLRKENISIDQYISHDNDLINYWLNIFNKHQIHGRSDSCYENSIAKLLEFGFTKEIKVFDEKFNFLLEDKYWEKGDTFEEMLMKVVIYPFLIRSGYWNNKNLNNFFLNRLEKIESTFWMLLILSNLYKNQCSFKSWPNTKEVLV